ncbi:MAG: enterochelin esterase [Lachnospiraceae bacterium]|nr:enterochelin esterase [Lachnospiraceae bacterium]
MVNQLYYAQGLAHNKIMPGNFFREFGDRIEHTERIPYGAEVMDDGNVRFEIYAPKADEVIIARRMDNFKLKKNSRGMWSGTCHLGYGYHNLNILIDGNEVLYPFIPIGFGFSRPVNYVDVPDPEDPWTRIENVPHGAVVTEYFHSSVTEMAERLLVYLPAEYHVASEKRYPVLYLQHGHGENENCWVNQGKVNFIMDNLIAQKKAVPMILIMANGMVQKRETEGRRIDSRLFENVLLEDIIPFVDKNYRTIDNREARAMAGLSMGSMQTSVITFKHQDLFAWAGLFSGFLRDIMNEDASRSHLEHCYADTFSSNMKLLFRAMGNEDEFFAEFEEDDRILEESGISNERRIYKGRHEWKVWRECIQEFAQLIFVEGK